MQALCAYESVALGTSAFCNLFTPTEWEDFTYANDLGKFIMLVTAALSLLKSSLLTSLPLLQSFGTRPALVILMRLHSVRAGPKN